jgi:hypothetical protein
VNETLDFFKSLLPFGISRSCPVFFVWTRRTCCPRLTPPRGARYKSTPKTQVFKTSREPLARFFSMRTRPVSPGRRVSVLQSTTLGLFGQGVGGDDFLVFRPPGCSCNAFNLLDFRRLGKGGFSEFSLLDPTRRRFRRQPYNISPSPTPVNPAPRISARRCSRVSRGAPSIVLRLQEGKGFVPYRRDERGRGAVLARRGRVGYCNGRLGHAGAFERRT